ncbi:MAG: oxygen-independent coproporphyrinogen III oxidase [Saprospiraceae bacterium]|nr:oxygen-independent coproporphyrinogen III oxidase [Saprospiraceae bacterium]MCB9328944.1 oxygen-independent coproporphyrinogen III oxidase [Lewinellaceae bacterium]
MSNLIQKYNIPGPRYTSYPTVPFWDKGEFDLETWKNSVVKSFSESNDTEGISLYIHLPYCEKLCTFCGCHKRITKNHSVELPYIETLLKEWKLYLELFDNKPFIKELHLGGGTPTFFSPDMLKKLIEGIFTHAERAVDFEYSYEAHPNNTTPEHLKTLYDLGFERNSFGVQDYDALVQTTINRIQSFEDVREATYMSRAIGYKSVSHDLIFGLPKQTEESIAKTIELTNELRPDRIAFYSYAHVPWIKGTGQRGYDESDLPSADLKRKMYELGKKLLAENGYLEIGMDHFALPNDNLTLAMNNGLLHRNFMGYTAGKTQLMIGLGMSAISDSWYAFAQNIKSVEEYQEAVNKGVIPVFRGHFLTEVDLVVRRHILNIMCQFETNWEADEMKFEELENCLSRLNEMQDDQLVIIDDNQLSVTEKGRPFVRNICMAFDLRLHANQPSTRIFSMTV